MRLFVLGLLLFASPAFARQSESERTIGILRQWSRAVAVHRHDRKPIPCLHTADVAREHIDLYKDWQRTRRWPLMLSEIHSDKPNRYSKEKCVVRIAGYWYENSSFQFEMSNQGRLGMFCNSYEFGSYGEKGFVDARKFNQTLRLMTKLPPSQRVFTVQDIVVVSGRVRGRWITRVYSRRHLPRQVDALIHLLDSNLFKP